MKKLLLTMMFAFVVSVVQAQLSDVKAQVDHMAKGNRNIGTQVTNLTMTDVDGKEHQLSEWCGKGNYVLIDLYLNENKYYFFHLNNQYSLNYNFYCE